AVATAARRAAVAGRSAAITTGRTVAPRDFHSSLLTHRHASLSASELRTERARSFLKVRRRVAHARPLVEQILLGLCVQPMFASFFLRALGVAAAWGVGALPIALGLARCPIAKLFHTPCPGCGMTRAMHLLLHGEIGPSLHMHALALPSLLASLLVMAATTWA